MMVSLLPYKSPNQALQATADKRLSWHVGRHRPAVPELFRYAMKASSRVRSHRPSKVTP